MQSNLYTIRQVAETGLLSEYTLRKLAKQGRLPAIYVGHKCLINLEQLKQQLCDLPGNVCKDNGGEQV